MAASLTECWRTWDDIGAGVEALTNTHAKCFLYDIGCQLACARQGAVELTFDILALADAAHQILDEWLTFLNDEHLLAFAEHTAHQFLGQRIL